MTKETVLKSPLSNNTLQVFKLTNDKCLELQGVKIIARKSDGYINLNQMCKSGNRDFRTWKKSKRAKEFLKVYEKAINENKNSCMVNIDHRLIKYEIASSTDKANWGHPQVAINVATWISPEFEYKVSKWIFELMSTGSVTLGKEKSQEEIEQKYRETIEKLQNESQEKDNKIKLMTDENFKLIRV